jgi:hypothetical protein
MEIFVNEASLFTAKIHYIKLKKGQKLAKKLKKWYIYSKKVFTSIQVIQCLL